MPTILVIQGYRFFFFSLDRVEPIHIHVEKGDYFAKYWLQPIVLARSKGFRNHELTQIRRIIEQYQQEFIESWYEHFSK